MSNLSDKTKAICGETLLKDATAWFKSGRRRFVRSPETTKSLGAKLVKANDAIFARQNEHIDESMRNHYEVRATKYGVYDELPWVIEEKKEAAREARKAAREAKAKEKASAVSS